MLGLKLREEFQGDLLKGTAIELATNNQDGATQIAAEKFLEITYPTRDLLQAIEAVSSKNLKEEKGRPVVVIGERGSGKSHLMAALYHVVQTPDLAQKWLDHWAARLNDACIKSLTLRQEKMHVICENMNDHNYNALWDVLFNNLSQGQLIKGQWLATKTAVPSKNLILQLLESQPAILILDEFQTWYDCLEGKQQEWAFSFIQMLSEIAQNHPDRFVLVVSVRNGESNAYQQVHRLNPVRIDFKAGGTPEEIYKERCHMLIHRLFENHAHISEEDIIRLITPHMNEYFRLCAVSPSEHARWQQEFIDSYPYSPHLLRLLEEQVLMATSAQDKRDLIRILAALYKSRGHLVPLLTAADFRLDGETETQEMLALLDSVSNDYYRKLKDTALQNMLSVSDTVLPPPPPIWRRLSPLYGFALSRRGTVLGLHLKNFNLILPAIKPLMTMRSLLN